MTKPLLFIFFLVWVAVPLTVSAQDQEYILLHNGTVLEGKVVSYEEGGSSSIKTTEGKVIVLYTDEIDRISAVPIEAPSDGSFEPPTKGFYQSFQMGLLSGKAVIGSSVNFSSNISNGYHFNEHWAVGVGTGIESFISRAYIPFYAEGRLFPWQVSTAPFVSVKGGYNFTTARDDVGYETVKYKAGPMFSIALGVRSMTNKDNAFEISIGYRYQYLNWTTTYGEWNEWWGTPPYPPGTTVESVLNINRFELKAGIFLQ